MNSNDPIEVTAASVDEAISDALRRLGADHDDVIIEVLSTPRSGVLGLGARQARVRVARRPQPEAHSEAQSPPPAPPMRPTPPRHQAKSAGQSAPNRPQDDRRAKSSQSEQSGEGAVGETRVPEPGSDPSRTAPPRIGSHSRPRRDPAAERPGAEPSHARADDPRDDEHGEPRSDPRSAAEHQAQVREARALLEKMLELMGEKAEVREIADDDSAAIALEIKGDGSGILIGRHGQTLDAMEYMLGRLLARKVKEPAPIVLETESYRARRRQQLHRMALQMGERAKREHTAVRLEPMAPRDRRVIHVALKDDPLVSTRSAGDGFMRAVEIVPVSGGSGGGRRERDGRERRREPPSEAPVGQQGGFKHGQKKII